MDVYEVSEDGGTFRLSGIDVLAREWLPKEETFSVMHSKGDVGNVRCLYDTRFFRKDEFGRKVCILISSLHLINIIFVCFLLFLKSY